MYTYYFVGNLSPYNCHSGVASECRLPTRAQVGEIRSNYERFLALPGVKKLNQQQADLGQSTQWLRDIGAKEEPKWGGTRLNIVYNEIASGMIRGKMNSAYQKSSKWFNSTSSFFNFLNDVEAIVQDTASGEFNEAQKNSYFKKLNDFGDWGYTEDAEKVGESSKWFGFLLQTVDVYSENGASNSTLPVGGAANKALLSRIKLSGCDEARKASFSKFQSDMRPSFGLGQGQIHLKNDTDLIRKILKGPGKQYLTIRCQRVRKEVPRPTYDSRKHELRVYYRLDRVKTGGSFWIDGAISQKMRTAGSSAVVAALRRSL